MSNSMELKIKIANSQARYQNIDYAKRRYILVST